jgi:ankyrin repeat protein
MDVIERALNGDDVNIVDQYGQTALMYAIRTVVSALPFLRDLDNKAAIRKDIIETVELLLDKGADPNMVGNDGTTALMTAIISGDIEIVELLLDKGAHTNIVNTYGQTALISAAWYGHSGIVELLLDRGANPNIVDKYDKTALLVASVVGNIDIVKLLLDNGADINIVDKYDKTALMCASQYGYTGIVKLINDKINLQKVLQNLALAKSMDSPECDSPLQYLDYDTMKEIMICKRVYNHSVHMRMKG